MSGIAVIVRRDGAAVSDEIVTNIGRSMTYRGPDGLRIERTGSKAIIYAGLAATPEAAFETQPFRVDDGAWLVADIRIDNRDELIGMLGWDRPPAKTPDIDLFAAAHRRWGHGLVDRIVGDFAAVVIDGDGRLTCFRDHLGVKPLYYWCTDDWIVVASGLREIAAHPAVSPVLDRRMMVQYLSGRVDDSVATAMLGVKRLPAGHGMSIDDRVRTWRYWTLPSADPIGRDDLAEYAAAFRTSFIESVRCRLRTQGGAACELSGGLDSTSVAAVSAQLVEQREVPATGLRAYSCLFPDSPRSDERPYIDLAVERIGLRWEPIISDPLRQAWIGADVEFWSDIPLPPDGPEHLALARSAVDADCKVVLTGHGGDDWFDPSAVALDALVGGRRPAAAWAVANRWTDGDRVAALRMLLRYGLLPHKPSWVRRPGARRAPWVIGAAREAAGLDDRSPGGRAARHGRSPLGQWYEETMTDGYAAMTREILDRVAALGGVEARHPYMDRRLVELACRAPITAHTTSTEDRALQRAGLRGLIPDEIADRTSKGSFNEVWFREIERHLTGPIEHSRPAELGWIDRDATAAMWRATEQRIRSGSGGGHLFPLWGIMQVDALLGHFPTATTEDTEATR